MSSRRTLQQLAAIGSILAVAATACGGATSQREPTGTGPHSGRSVTGPIAAVSSSPRARAGTPTPTTGRTSQTTARPVVSTARPSADQEVADPITRIVARMPLRDKVGQLMVVEFPGTSAPRQLIRALHPGGLIYFSDNLDTNDQIRAMSRQAQQVARRDGQPLLLMTDQEGGLVTRLPGTDTVPGGAEFGGDAGWARRTARRTGRLMSGLGLNVDLAPVADVNTAGSGGVIGSRSFSARPRVVSRMVRAQICGYHAGGVAATVKHFPGHGGTLTDSHAQTAVVTRTARQWRRIDLPPFRAAVAAHVDLILVGHLAVPSLDPTGRPATISEKLTRHLLRRDLGYEGVVITDALNMGGITSWGSPGTIAVRSLRAGVDLLLMPPDKGAALRGVIDAVRAGRLSERRVDESVKRVLRLKRSLGLYGAPKSLWRC